MTTDIRDKRQLSQTDILNLNFIKNPCPFFFRRHHRSGLRSHIMEVLAPGDVRREKEGVMEDGMRWFPKAQPLKILRIFRTRFSALEDTHQELTRVKRVASYLAPRFMALSNEFLVSYLCEDHEEILLCGLQEYVTGEIIDPWGPLDEKTLWTLFCRMDTAERADERKSSNSRNEWTHIVYKRAEKFLTLLRHLAMDARLIPDLAGIGNLLLTPDGTIKLVDINNISSVSLKGDILSDDRGYPVCDKSVEALSLLEQKLLGRSRTGSDSLYRIFLDSERMKKVRELEKHFHRSMKFSGVSYPVCGAD